MGADITMLASALLKNGPNHLAKLQAELIDWLGQRDYESVRQMKGSMSHRSCSDPSAFERANYMRALNTFRA